MLYNSVLIIKVIIKIFFVILINLFQIVKYKGIVCLNLKLITILLKGYFSTFIFFRIANTAVTYGLLILNEYC